MGLDLRIPGRKNKQTSASQGTDIWKPPENLKEKFEAVFTGKGWLAHQLAWTARVFVCFAFGKHDRERKKLLAKPCTGAAVLNVYA